MSAPSCCHCGKPSNFPVDPKSELRPYGPGGKPVCYRCAFESPEREQESANAFGAQLAAAEAIGDGAAVLTPEGPSPSTRELREVVARAVRDTP